MSLSDLQLVTGSQVNMPMSAQNWPSTAAGSQRAPWTTLFDQSSISAAKYTKTLSADGHGFLFQAFGLSSTESLVVEQVVGPNEGDLFQAMRVNGVGISLSSNQTLLFLPLPSRVRLRYEHGTGVNRLGSIYAYVTPVPPENFTAMMAFGVIK